MSFKSFIKNVLTSGGEDRKFIHETDECIDKEHAELERLYKENDSIMQTLKEELEAAKCKAETELEKAKLEFEYSISYARAAGVPEDQILHNKEEVDEFFMRKD